MTIIACRKRPDMWYVVVGEQGTASVGQFLWNLEKIILKMLTILWRTKS